MMNIKDLEKEFKAQLVESENEYSWYKTHRLGYLILSWVIRIVAIVLLIIGTVLSISSGVKEIVVKDITLGLPSQVGITCFLLAGLTIGVDKVFLISKTWGRYAKAMMRIKTIQKTVSLDWKAQKAMLVEPVSKDEVQSAFNLFKTMVISTRQVIETETSSWSDEITEATTQLQNLISELRTKSIPAIKKNSPYGAVRVIIKGAENNLKPPIIVTLGDECSETKDKVVSTMILSKIPSGLHKITLKGKNDKGQPVEMEDVVQVSPNKISEVEFVL